METKIILKEPIISKKFGVLFPKNKELNSFTDSNGFIFVQHPIHENVYTRVRKKNIKTKVI